MEKRTGIRVALFLVAGVCVLSLVGSYLSYAGGTKATIDEQATRPYAERTPVVPPREGITVLTAQNTGNVEGKILAFAPDGRLLYYNASRGTYFDVDPVPGTAATVEYVATLKRPDDECEGETPCLSNVVERVNLTTGETDRIYTRSALSVPGSNRWHDVDRLNSTHLLVANIALDRVAVVNTSSGIIEWTWSAESAYPPESGGKYDGDWTHLNDVERLADGRIVASLRNHDQVVFLTGDGLQRNRTLGADDDHSTLYEQHNPDYIPESRGGPALVVADSENNRIVEYQRADGSWERSWTWQDATIQWPRDADRLPNDNTLVTDSHGHRVLEVAPNGSVVWQVETRELVYEAERLGTGDESSGGWSAKSVGYRSRTVSATGGDSSPSPGARVWAAVRSFVPGPVLSGVFFVLPPWITASDLFAAVGLVGSLSVLGVVELRSLPVEISLRNPVRIRRKR